jgi:hypothetical protein
MPRLAPIQPGISVMSPGPDTSALAFSYLYLFRRIVVGLAVAGAALAYVQQWPGLCAACICIGIGEWLETSYYLNVLRWRQDRGAAADPVGTGIGSPADSSGARGSSQATITSTTTVSSTPTNTI